MTKYDKIKAFRVQKNLNQDAICEKLGIQRASYSMIESGKNSIKIEHLEKLIEMGLNPMWFFLDRGEMLLEKEVTPVVLPPRKKPILFGSVEMGNNSKNTININQSELDTLRELLAEKERTIQILLNKK